MKQDTLYLEEDFSRVARFRNAATGTFDSAFWDDRMAFQVLGESTQDDPPIPNAFPSPAQLAIASRPGTNTSWQTNLVPAVPSTSGFGKTKAAGFQRIIFLGEFDMDLKLQKTHTAYLRLNRDSCDVNQAARLVKEYLNLEEDLVIVDVHGYQLMDNQCTRRKLSDLCNFKYTDSTVFVGHNYIV